MRRQVWLDPAVARRRRVLGLGLVPLLACESPFVDAESAESAEAAEPAEPCDPLVVELAEATWAMPLDRSSWETGVALQGLAAVGLCEELPPSHAERLRAWADARGAETTPPDSVNWGAVAGALARIDRVVGVDGVARDRVDVIADYLLAEHPRTEVGGPLVHSGDQLWIDTTFMVVGLGMFSSDAMFDEAVTQILEHSDRMQDPQTDLYFHGWDYSDAMAGSDPHGPGVFWARGNGWVALASAEVVRHFDRHFPDDPRRDDVADRLRRQLDALAPLQTADGLWRTIVDDETAYEETSGSAAIALAFTIAAQQGVHASDATVGRATAGIRNAIRDGGLEGVSGSTALPATAQGYLDVPVGPPQPWGQGLALLLFAES